MTLAVSSSFASCSKDDAPNEDWCVVDDYKADVKLNVSVDKTMFSHADIVVDNPETRAGVMPRRYSAGVMQLRYNAWIFKEDDATPIAHASSLYSNFSFSLPLGKYRALAWVDYVPGGIQKDFYFFTDDLTEMLLMDKAGYSGNDNNKMAFCNETHFTVSYRTPEVFVSAVPQMAQYRIIANDSPSFDVGYIRISYPENVPAALNAFTREVSYCWSGVSYQHSYDGNFVTTDNVFANDDEHKVAVKVEVFDLDGKLRARRLNVSIPVRKGGITLARANIFSILEEDPDDPKEPSGGGVGIDPDFDDTFEIII